MAEFVRTQVMPQYKTRDLMTILALALVVFLVGYIFKPIEALLFSIGLAGWWVSGFVWGILNFPVVIAHYKIRKLGVATLTLLIGFFIRILLGSPMANILIFYALAWGLPSDAILALFKHRRNPFIYVLAWGVAGVFAFWAADFIFFREAYSNFHAQYGWIAISGVHRVAGGIAGAIVGWFFAKSLERVGLMD